MLSNKRLTILAETVVDDAKIARFGAVLEMDTMALSFSNGHLDKEACKQYKDIVRADQAEFEDFAYELQDMLKGK